MTATMVAERPEETPISPAGLAPLAWRTALLIAAAKAVLQIATSPMYGMHRDEFYYLAAGNHPAWGYVDQPPITPMLYRLAQALMGNGIVALHVIPAILGGALVVLGAALAREMGGGKWAQMATAVVAALGPIYLTTSHFLSTVSVDLVFWAVATLLILRMIRTGDQRWWVAVGGVVGLGLLNKDTMILWVAGMGVGLLVTPYRKLIGGRWFAIGVILAAVIVAPNIDWQITHHWATLQFTSGLRKRTAGQNLAQFIPTIAGLASPAALGIWIIGVRKTIRTLAVAAGVIVLLVLVSGGKGYYAGSIALPLVAAGAVAVETSWAARTRRRWLTSLIVSDVLLAPLFMPILPMALLSHIPLQKVNDDLSAMLGWHAVARDVAAVARTLPPAQRARAVVLTGNYSEAGAIQYWQKDLDLPPAISGHNNYYFWGWAPAGDGPIITIGIPALDDQKLFTNCRAAGVVGGPGALVDNNENGAELFVCNGPRHPWPELWTMLKHFE